MFMGKLSVSEQEVSTLTAKLEQSEKEVSSRLGDGMLVAELKHYKKETSTLTSKLRMAEDKVGILTMDLETSNNEVKTLSSKLGDKDMVESIQKDVMNDNGESLLTARLKKSEREILQLKEALIEERGFANSEQNSFNATREKLNEYCASLERKVKTLDGEYLHFKQQSETTYASLRASQLEVDVYKKKAADLGKSNDFRLGFL